MVRTIILAIAWLHSLLLFSQTNIATIAYSNDSAYVRQRVSELKKIDHSLFQAATFSGDQGIQIQYRLFSPERETTTAQQFPLVVIFHGSGQAGTDNKAQLGLLPSLFAHAESQARYPAYILAPQFPTRSSDYTLDSVRHVLKSTPRPCLQVALQLVDSLKEVLAIDPSRIYVVGYSMGASTVINAISARPELFAAGISIAGIPQFDRGNEIVHIPLWLIHGLADDVNTIESDEYFFREFNRPSLRFWKLEGVNHDILTTPTVLDSLIPDWLFQQTQP